MMVKQTVKTVLNCKAPNYYYHTKIVIPNKIKSDHELK